MRRRYVNCELYCQMHFEGLLELNPMLCSGMLVGPPPSIQKLPLPRTKLLLLFDRDHCQLCIEEGEQDGLHI